jgi:hypothetical protein
MRNISYLKSFPTTKVVLEMESAPDQFNPHAPKAPVKMGSTSYQGLFLHLGIFAPYVQPFASELKFPF